MTQFGRNIERLCRRVEDITKVQCLTLDEEMKMQAEDIFKGQVISYEKLLDQTLKKIPNNFTLHKYENRAA